MSSIHFPNTLPLSSGIGYAITIAGSVIAYKVQKIVSSRIYNQYKEQFHQWKEKHPTAYWITGLTLHLATCALAVFLGALLSETVGFSVSTFATGSFIALPFGATVAVEGVKFAQKREAARLASALNIPEDAQEAMLAVLDDPEKAVQELRTHLGLSEEDVKGLLANPEGAVQKLGSQLGLTEEGQQAPAIKAVVSQLGLSEEGQKASEGALITTVEPGVVAKEGEKSEKKDKGALEKEIKQLQIARERASVEYMHRLKKEVGHDYADVVDENQFKGQWKAQLEEIRANIVKLKEEIETGKQSKAKEKVWSNRKGIHREIYYRWCRIFFLGQDIVTFTDTSILEIWKRFRQEESEKSFEYFVIFVKKLYAFQLLLNNFEKTLKPLTETPDELSLLEKRRDRLEMEVKVLKHVLGHKPEGEKKALEDKQEVEKKALEKKEREECLKEYEVKSEWLEKKTLKTEKGESTTQVLRTTMKGFDKPFDIELTINTEMETAEQAMLRALHGLLNDVRFFEGFEEKIAEEKWDDTEKRAFFLDFQERLASHIKQYKIFDVMFSPGKKNSELSLKEIPTLNFRLVLWKELLTFTKLLKENGVTLV